MTLAHIGRFQVERALGSGSYATVWLGRDEDLDAWVAIKLLAENWSMHADARRRFLEEARALRRLDSDRIVRVYELGHLTDGRPYMVMEFADRGTLEDRLRLRGQLDQPFSVQEAVGLSLDIAECLIAVHDLRIVHRDVKPSNVLFRTVPRERQDALSRDGQPVSPERTLLGDFGIARRLEGLLAHTMVLGSPLYMAPEQADPDRAATVEYRSDIYSAAVVLYESLTGRVPFAGQTPEQLKGVRPEAPRVEAVRPDVPGALADVLARALDPDPAGRIGSARAWRDALRASIDGEKVTHAEWARVPGRDERVIDLRPGRSTPEVDTVPVAVGAGAIASTTLPAPTFRGTAPLPEAPAASSAPAVRAIGQFPARDGSVSTLNVRVPGGFTCAAAVLMLVSVFLPWSADTALRSHAGAEFRSGALVAIEAALLFLFGLRLWRTRRRWVASLVALAVALFGLAGIGLAMYELVRLGKPSNAQGLFVLLGANLAAAVAGYRAQARLSTARRKERYPNLRTV